MSACIGLIRTRINPPITPPMIGPKVGSRLVTPTTSEIRGTYAIPVTIMNTALIRPMISASRRLQPI